MLATPLNSDSKIVNSHSNNNNDGIKDIHAPSKISALSFDLLNGSSHHDPRVLIPELCRHFYNLGWASGTGGGLSIREAGRIYCAPSGVQKERIKSEDMFVLDEQARIIERPRDSKLKCSECLSLFMAAFELRNAGCCIHSHSIYANLITGLHSKNYIELKQSKHENLIRDNLTSNEFRISKQEMIKGLVDGSTGEPLRYTDTLVVPIIDNVLYERDLSSSMYEIMKKYPKTNAVLVRDHGVYVWGKNWTQAKSMAECYDYLFRLKLEAVRLGFDWMI